MGTEQAAARADEPARAEPGVSVRSDPEDKVVPHRIRPDSRHRVAEVGTRDRNRSPVEDRMVDTTRTAASNSPLRSTQEVAGTRPPPVEVSEPARLLLLRGPRAPAEPVLQVVSPFPALVGEPPHQVEVPVRKEPAVLPEEALSEDIPAGPRPPAGASRGPHRRRGPPHPPGAAWSGASFCSPLHPSRSPGHSKLPTIIVFTEEGRFSSCGQVTQGTRFIIPSACSRIFFLE